MKVSFGFITRFNLIYLVETGPALSFSCVRAILPDLPLVDGVTGFKSPGIMILSKMSSEY